MEKISTAEILRMNSKPIRTFAVFPRFGKPSSAREPQMICLESAQPSLFEKLAGRLV
jgi:hypothetical protein